MKKVMMLVLVAALVSPAMAAYSVKLFDTDGRTTAGGPFEVQGIGNPFNTFCVEWDQANLHFNVTYSATIDDVVLFEGANAALKKTTKELYASYLNAGSPEYAVGAAYYNSILASESGVGTIDNTLITNTSGWENVRVLNLWTPGYEYTQGFNYDIQSQLIMVPAPGALLLGSMGMGLVGWLRRRQAV